MSTHPQKKITTYNRVLLKHPVVHHERVLALSVLSTSGVQEVQAESR